MYKQSPSGRSHRSRGVKVKHVLQICVLLAVCFWLIYQVKQSHEKKKQVDGIKSKLSEETGSRTEVRKLGRKYLPRTKEIAEDNSSDEKNDEDPDEHDREKIDDEVEREDGVIDDEKGEHSEDNENDEDSRSMHEAQEELYKADDASSAVTHDTRTATTENENVDSEEGQENEEANVREQVGKVGNDTEINDGQDTTPTQDVKTAESVGYPNATSHEEPEQVSNSRDISSSNITSMEGSNLANTTLELSTNSAFPVNNSLSDSNLTTLKNGNAESTESSESEKLMLGRPRFSTQDDRWSSDAEKSGMNDETSSTDDEGFESFNTENIGEVEDLIDSSDSSLPQEEKDARTDLETLPEIQTEGSNTEDLAA